MSSFFILVVSALVTWVVPSGEHVERDGGMEFVPVASAYTYFGVLQVVVLFLTFARQIPEYMVSNKKLRNISRLLFPLLFVFYWGGITLFSHSHVLNGVIVVHSHPFKSGHTHSESGLETIFFLTHFNTSGEEIVSHPVIPGLLLLCVFLIPALLAGVNSHSSRVVSLRAPPSFVF